MSVCRTGGFLGPVAAALVSCTLTTSLDGLEGPPPTDRDGGPGAETSTADTGDATVIQTDAGPRLSLVYPSCATRPPGSPDGVYLIDPDGPGPQLSFHAYCDMTNDGGGWMLVTKEMLGADTNVEATVVTSKDDRGGLVMSVYANSPGCASGVPSTPRAHVPRRPRDRRRLRAVRRRYGERSELGISGHLREVTSKTERVGFVVR